MTSLGAPGFSSIFSHFFSFPDDKNFNRSTKSTSLNKTSRAPKKGAPSGGKLETNKIFLGDAREVLKTFPKESIDMCVTSPPYWGLRDYGVNGVIWDSKEDCKHEFEYEKVKKSPITRGELSNKVRHAQGYRNFKRGFCKKCNAWKGQLGLEPNPELFVKHLCDIFDEVKKVLKKEGTCWVNLGDTYFGSGSNSSKSKYPRKSLLMIPSRFAIEMINKGWILRNVIIWHKPNAIPSSIKDRFTVDFEYLFLFSKNKKYYFNQQREPHRQISLKRNKDMCHPDGRNMRCVWTIPTSSFKGEHIAMFPEKLIEVPIKAGCQENGIVLDPFMGSGTTAITALKQNKKFLGIELNKKYKRIAEKRIGKLL